MVSELSERHFLIVKGRGGSVSRVRLAPHTSTFWVIKFSVGVLILVLLVVLFLLLLPSASFDISIVNFEEKTSSKTLF